MLSIENNPDPLCSYKISRLKNDERASGTVVALEEADLLKSSLVDDDDNHLPTFSIRDYAFTARRKGIEKNWPFPQEYLQLCLKHGIRDLLPPFEPPDSVRNRPFEKNIESAEVVFVDGRKSVEEVNLLEEKNIGLDGKYHRSESEPCLSIDQSVIGLLDQTQSPLQEQEKLTAHTSGTVFCRLSVIPDLDEIEAEVLPSKTTINVQSKREKIYTSKLPCSGELGATSKALIELEVPGASQKNKNTIESPGKKCKYLEKSGIISGTSRTEDIVSNTTTVSEPMASKVCPVCKTFLSTSNTTLNAHIDQCLAAESTSKLTGDFQLSKHKIKPRKKRLMVDIYATAPYCTLEELDRRNGSNWAAGSSLPTAEAEVCAEGKRPRLSQAYVEDIIDESAVYFDSNGRKVRILSKLDDASVPRPVEDMKPRKHINENKERNTACLLGKVKRLGSKDSKHMKIKPQNKTKRFQPPDETEIWDGPEGNNGLDENCEKEESHSKAHDQINSNQLTQWACSKRTGLSKKLNGKDACQGLGLMIRDPLTESPSMPMQIDYNQKTKPEVVASSSGSPSPKIYENAFPMRDLFRDCATPSNTRSNCFQPMEEHIRPGSGTEAWRGSSERHFSDGQESQLSKDISDIIQRIRTSSDEDCRAEGSSYSEIERTQCESEPISIPGPPGYFLPPSPGDISSEIQVENSSLTSDRLPSSQDQCLLVDGDSSGSPVSATSTISHLHTSRSEPNSFVGSSAALEKFVPGFSSDDNTKPLVGDINTLCAPNIENGERINSYKEYLKATKKSPEGSLKVSDDQCRCSWKERIHSDDPLMYQALQLPRQHNMAQSESPSMPMQIDYNHKTRPEVIASSSGSPCPKIYENVIPLRDLLAQSESPSMPMQIDYNQKTKPEVVASSSGSPSPKIYENVIPMRDLFRDCVNLKAYSEAALKFSGHGDFSFASSSARVHNTHSTSNPVLRLMGKNLMVVNQEEGSSSELKETSPVTPDSKYPMLQGFSSGNMTTEDNSSLYRMASDGSVIFNDRYDQHNRSGPHLSESFGNHSHSKIHHANLQPPAANHYNNHHVGGFVGSLPQHGSKDVIDHLQTVHGSLVDRSNSLVRYNVERASAAPQQNKNSASAAPISMREVIVIDDSPEIEADLSRKYTQASRGGQISPLTVGSLSSPNLDPNLRQVNPFYSYPSQNYFSQRETPVGTYPVLCPRGTTGSPAKQGDNASGSGLLLHSSSSPVYRRPIL